MIVTNLRITDLRCIESIELRFQPGFNLLVGENGVGKTSVLDALRVCLSATVKRANRLRDRPETFSVDDIRVGRPALTIGCGFRIAGHDYNYTVHKPRETATPQEKGAGLPRAQVHETPLAGSFLGLSPSPVSGREHGGRPLSILFSTRRAVPSGRAPSKKAAAGGTRAAFGDALTDRELRLGEIAAWLRVQDALKSERASSRRALATLDDAVSRLLPEYERLRVESHEPRRLLIDRAGTTVPVRQLSDGERGLLALTLDLTRRLVQANPELSDPAAEAEAVVLIDELDLHLHPRWQRQIVQNLTTTFPRCQFLATTHSPQVVGEVQHDRIQIIADGQVYSPSHSLGVDSSRVLEEIMSVDSRTHEVSRLLSRVARAIGKQKYESAHCLLSQLVEKLGEDDPEVNRIATLLDFMESDE